MKITTSLKPAKKNQNTRFFPHGVVFSSLACPSMTHFFLYRHTTRAERRLNIRVHQISRNKYLGAPLTSSNRCLDLPVQSLGLTQECKQH